MRRPITFCLACLLLIAPVRADENQWRAFTAAGEAALMKRDFPQAAQAYQAALKAASDFAANDQRRGLALNGLTTALLGQRDHGAAAPLVKEALDFWAQTPATAAPHLATALHHLAGLQQIKGDDAAALETLKRALALRQESLPADHPALQLTRKSMAALTGSGEAAEGSQAGATPTDGKALYALHLASMKSVKLAEAEWARLQRDHGAQLKDLPFTLQQADLGTRGIFQRVMAGRFAARNKAAALCQALQRKGQYCQVVAQSPSS